MADHTAPTKNVSHSHELPGKRKPPSAAKLSGAVQATWMTVFVPPLKTLRVRRPIFFGFGGLGGQRTPAEFKLAWMTRGRQAPSAK
jgi:hypothetical protein